VVIKGFWLLQQFAKNSLAIGEVNDVTKQKLAEIGAQLNDNTWMASVTISPTRPRYPRQALASHLRELRSPLAPLLYDIDGYEVQ